jgi:hypothetical protein
MTQLTKWEKERQHSVYLSSIRAEIFLAKIAIKYDGDGRLDSHNVLKTLKRRLQNMNLEELKL